MKTQLLVLGGLMIAGCSPSGPEEVSFKGYKEFELKGTVLAPGGIGRKSAVLLLPGSGPTDRDGNQPPMVTDLLKAFSRSITDAGFVTLRFDKRAAHVYAAGWPKDGLEDFFSWQAFLDDAAAGLRFLRGRKDVDPEKVFILGHSEGGMIALKLAADLGEKEKPAGLILAGTPGRPMRDILRDQLTHLMTMQGAPPAVMKEYLDITDRAITSVEKDAKVPTDLPAGLQPLFPSYAGRLLQGYARWNPGELAKGYDSPVLILNGEHDSQVSATKDASRLLEFFNGSGKANAKLVMVPAASHNFKRASGPNDPAFAGPVVESAIQPLINWLKGQK